MSKEYSLIFKAVDQVSGVANQIDGKLGSLFSKISGVGGALEGVGVKGTASLAALSLGVLAIGAAFATVTAGVALFNSQLEKSISLQSQQALTSIGVANATGKSLDQSDVIVNEVTKRVAEQTAKLPGSTEKYTSIALSALSQVSKGGKSNDQISSDSVKLSSLFGVYGQGETGGQLNNVVLETLSGQRSLAQLRRLEFFSKNVDLFDRFSSQLNKQGVTDTKGADQSKVLSALFAVAPTKEEIARVQKTYSSKLEDIMSNLFDPVVGIFGFSRQITTRGNRQVIDAAADTLTEIVDVFNQISKILGRSGLTSESIITAIYDGIGRFSDFLQGIEDNLKNNESLYSSIFSGVQKTVGVMYELDKFFINLNFELFGLIGKTLGAVSSAISYLDVSMTAIPNAIIKFAQGIADVTSAVTNKLSGAVGSVSQVVSGQSSPATYQSIGSQAASIATGGVSDLIGGLFNTITGAKYDGNLPGLDFIRSENNFKPSGSKTVVANDSEFILTPSQMKNLVSNLQTAPVYNINVTSAGDGQSIADTVVATIERHWHQTKLSSF